MGDASWSAQPPILCWPQHPHNNVGATAAFTTRVSYVDDFSIISQSLQRLEMSLIIWQPWLWFESSLKSTENLIKCLERLLCCINHEFSCLSIFAHQMVFFIGLAWYKLIVSCLKNYFMFAAGRGELTTEAGRTMSIITLEQHHGNVQTLTWYRTGRTGRNGGTIVHLSNSSAASCSPSSPSRTPVTPSDLCQKDGVSSPPMLPVPVRCRSGLVLRASQANIWCHCIWQSVIEYD